MEAKHIENTFVSKSLVSRNQLKIENSSNENHYVSCSYYYTFALYALMGMG